MEITFINSEIERLKALGYKHIVDNITLTIDSEKFHKENVDFMILTSINILNRNLLNNLNQFRIHLLSRTESRVVELTNIEQAKGFIVRGVIAVKVENLTSEILKINDALPINLNFIRVCPLKDLAQKPQKPQTPIAPQIPTSKDVNR